MYTLYGDGVHDDTAALQELLDQGGGEVTLAMPRKCYLISRTLIIHANQRLVLPRFCVIRLMDQSNCTMLANAPGEEPDSNIEVEGGIWDLNNLGQRKNPFLFPSEECPEYSGFILHFRRVSHFRLANLTLKDTVTFAVTLDTVSHFTVENIRFDFNHGNPWPVNMDGIHCNGNCHDGVIRNLHGACYDDLVALNADEGSAGPITNIDIDGIWSADCHSAVRLLTVKYPVENIRIRNVFGSFYQYCIGISKFYEGETTGHYDGITIDHIYASKAERHSIYQKDGFYVFPVIWLEGGVRVRSLHISDVYRKELITAVETVGINEDALVDHLTVENVSVENHTVQEMPLLLNNGKIGTLTTRGLFTDGDDVIVNHGEIGQHQNH